MNIIKQYKMKFFDTSANSNKVWIGMAYDNGLFETRFGRVREGANLQPHRKPLGSAAVSMLEQKHNEKLRKSYRDTSVLDNDSGEIVTSTSAYELSRLAVEQIGGASDTLTAELIKYLVGVNIHAITHSTSIRYNAANATFSTPLGVLTPSAVSEARTLLSEIEKANSSSFYSSSRERLICDYFRLVPADFGVKIPKSSELLASSDKLAGQIAILDSLEAALNVDTPTTPGEKLFKTSLSKISDASKFEEIRFLYESTLNRRHASSGLKLARIYEVEIESMKSNFETASKSFGNVRSDLWHGTKSSNLLSILKNGLMIPKSNSAHCTGRMFGDGIYTSLQSTKAL